MFQFDKSVPARALTGLGLAMAAALGMASLSPASAQQTADLQELFRQVIMNPTDQAANLRYAKAAEQRGELRKALSAYERMVLNNPNDTQARGEYERIKALLEPPQTELIGAQRLRRGGFERARSGERFVRRGRSSSIRGVKPACAEPAGQHEAATERQNERPAAPCDGEGHGEDSSSRRRRCGADASAQVVLFW